MNAKNVVSKTLAAMKCLAILSFVLALMLVPAAAQKNKPVPIPLYVDFRNDIADAVRSDGTIYDNGHQYIDAVNNVRADIYYGDFYFDTNENKGDGGRRVNLVFPSTCTVCPTSGPQDVYIATHYFDDLSTMKLNDTQVKGLAITWAAGTQSYVLRFNNQNDSSHGNVVFSCLEGSPCALWTATPNGPAGLYLKQSFKNQPYEKLLATVDMPFLMTLAKK